MQADDDILARAYAAREEMARDPWLARYVDCTLEIPRPFVGSEEIRLVIVGQDPTVQNERERERIRVVLNLDRPGPLRTYLARLCADLGVSLDENVYATNACKCFFTLPPTAIQEVDVLALSAAYWLPILSDELAQYPDAAVISLGQPVLGMLVRDRSSRLVRDYWGYRPGWRKGERAAMRAIEAEASTVGRRIYPFIHQPSLKGARSAFYKERWGEYVEFVRQTAAEERDSQDCRDRWAKRGVISR